MNLPKAMSRVARESRPEPQPVRPRVLLAVLVLLIVLGAVGATAAVLNARATGAATRADVIANRQVTERLAELTEQAAAAQETSNDSAVAFRTDNRRLLLAICDQIEAVARQAELTVPPSPRVPPA